MKMMIWRSSGRRGLRTLLGLFSLCLVYNTPSVEALSKLASCKILCPEFVKGGGGGGGGGGGRSRSAGFPISDIGTSRDLNGCYPHDQCIADTERHCKQPQSNAQCFDRYPNCLCSNFYNVGTDASSSYAICAKPGGMATCWLYDSDGNTCLVYGETGTATRCDTLAQGHIKPWFSLG